MTGPQQPSELATGVAGQSFGAASGSPSRRSHLDLFSGIGGFALAARNAGWETIGFSEINDHANKVLKRHWPNVPNYGDIRNVRGIRAELITGGFPCQPFSCAGKRRGAEDDRHLWPEMCRVIAEARPAWVLGENVSGIIGMELDRVLADLEHLGYSCWPLVIPAVACDAKHRRERVWIVAHANGGDSGEGRNGCPNPQAARPDHQPARSNQDAEHVADTDGQPARRAAIAWRECHQWQPEPPVGRVAHGIPNRMERLRGLGNAIVPQVAETLLTWMLEIHEAQVMANAEVSDRAGNGARS